MFKATIAQTLFLLSGRRNMHGVSSLKTILSTSIANARLF